MNLLTNLGHFNFFYHSSQKIHILVHGEKANLTDYKFIHLLEVTMAQTIWNLAEKSEKMVDFYEYHK